MNPSDVQTWFDANAIVLMFLGGVAVKYIPQLKNVSNAFIGWLNVAGYILSAVFVSPAHAGVLANVPDAINVLLGGATNAGAAMVLYETLGRTLLERIFKRKKAT